MGLRTVIQKRIKRPRFLWVYPLAAWVLCTARPTEASLRWGALLALLGEGLRLWANGYVGHRKVNWTQQWRNDPKIGQLITAGPYAFVRHPLYLGSFLIGLGFCVLAATVWLPVVALIFFLLVYRAKMLNEEETLREEGGEAYQRYHAAVPQWLPTGRRYDQRFGAWSWQGIVASKEWKTTLWLVVGLIVVYLREELLEEHGVWMGRHWLKHMGLVGVAVALIAWDAGFELMRRRRVHQSPTKNS